ncbi:MAG TPA: hypothetical protein VGO93_16980 [Candidatus Xenobia bacterium]|jgi:hypothetical protein
MAILPQTSSHAKGPLLAAVAVVVVLLVVVLDLFLENGAGLTSPGLLLATGLLVLLAWAGVAVSKPKDLWGMLEAFWH